MGAWKHSREIYDIIGSMQWECVRIYREANQAADLLSKEAIKKKSCGGLNLNFGSFKGIIAMDARGMPTVRVGKPIPT